jgi:cytochrome b561
MQPRYANIFSTLCGKTCHLTFWSFINAQYQIGHPTGTGPIEAKLADISHFLLYGFMTIMPATGIAMGYYGGKGL